VGATLPPTPEIPIYSNDVAPPFLLLLAPGTGLVSDKLRPIFFV
jgi:hypothetical protein